MPRSIVLGRAWPVPGEPLWLEEDTELALTWMAELRTICSGCGHPRDETTALDDRGRPLHDWEVGSTVCQACEARAVEEDRIRTDDKHGAAMRGRIFYTTRGGD